MTYVSINAANVRCIQDINQELTHIHTYTRALHHETYLHVHLHACTLHEYTYILTRTHTNTHSIPLYTYQPQILYMTVIAVESDHIENRSMRNVYFHVCIFIYIHTQKYTCHRLCAIIVNYVCMYM
jgi:hypothetical protein